MSFMSIAKPFAFALFTDSGSLLDRRIAFRPAREAAFGPPGRPTARFRRLGGRAEFRQKRRNYPMDPTRRQTPGRVAPLPRKPSVGYAGARQAQLREGGQDQPRPSIRLLGITHPRCGPPQSLFEEAEGVLQVEAPHVRAPEEIEVRRRPLRPVPPQPQETLGSRRLSPRGSRSTSTSTSVPTAMGRGPRVPLPAWFWTFGCIFAHARTRTDP
jgi:hypothetical protein